MSAAPRSNRVVWLVAGTSLAAWCVLAFTLYADDSEALEAWARAIALCSIGWLVLSCFLLRRQQWARWTAVAILVVIGFFLFVWELGDFLDSIAMGQPIRWDATFVVGLVFVVDAVLLVFPDPVGDFFARPELMKWSLAMGKGRAVPSRASSFDKDALLKSLPQKEMMARRVQRITALAIVLSWMLCAGAVAWKAHQRAIAFHNWQNGEEAAYRAVEDSSGDMAFVGHAFAGGIASIERLIDMIELLVLGYLALFVFPFFLTMPFVLPFASRWHEPVRFLILRPFNKEHITKSLSRFLRREFAPFGHCYTLSDRNVRVPLHVRVPLVLGQLSFFNFRARKIRRPKHIEKVVQALQARVRRNINWCFSRTKLFPIRCCDPGWQACVTRLVDEVHIIVADVSNVSNAIVWELQLLRDTGAIARTVFVVEESRLAAASEAVAKVMGSSQPVPVLSYGEDGDATEYIARASILNILGGSSAAASQHNQAIAGQGAS